MTSTMVQLFRHNLWANLRLLDACRHLSDEQLDARPTDGVYGNIRATLYHVVRNEERYLKLLLGHDLDDNAPAAATVPSLDELHARLQQSGDGFVQAVAELPESRVLQGKWNGQPYTMLAALPIIQAINHATEHRAQIAAVLTQVGVQPPVMDGWTFEEEGMWNRRGE